MNIRGELVASMTLMNFFEDDCGIYEVRAGNAFGEVTHIFQIQTSQEVRSSKYEFQVWKCNSATVKFSH